MMMMMMMMMMMIIIIINVKINVTSARKLQGHGTDEIKTENKNSYVMVCVTLYSYR